LSLPPEKNLAVRPLPVTGRSAIDYDERVLDASGAGDVQKTLRVYRRIDFDRTVGNQPQHSTIRPVVRRLVVLRHKNVEVPFSPDGPLTWGEIDLVRTDVFTPALNGLLPEKAVVPGDRWTAMTAAVQELTDMERIDEGQVACRFEEITSVGRRDYARVAFEGTVRGVNEDGPNRQQLDGYLFFDLKSRHVSYLSLKGTSYLLDKDGKALGEVHGQFVLTRQLDPRCGDLSDEAVRRMAVEPDSENTLLLYENPELGVRFLYPRRWRLAGTHGPQVAIDEANGSGLLITVAPVTGVPSAAQFLTESRDFLTKQKMTVLQVEQPREVPSGPKRLEYFSLEVENAGQRAIMEYYVSRQECGGVTLAARLLPADRPQVHRDVERIARSIGVFKAQPAPVGATGR
jgi:hypothetical protein